MTVDAIKTLLTHIPRYAEEEGDFYSVSREELTDVLCSKNEVSREVAENTIGLIENLLDTLAVLNPDYLQKGEWCFVSFPAQLLAMSLLTAMGDKESRFFANHFWNTQGISNNKKDQQRDILHHIETQRITCHNNQSPTPIRHIYVAWGIIKLDNQILLYQREDTQKRHDKSAGDYGLIGGRLNQHDIQSFSGDMQARLQALQSDNVEFIKESLPTTLKRELREEARLIFETHYTFKSWRTLKPYNQVQGSAPNHAYTQYYFEIFHIELTLEGYLFLQQKVKSDDRLVWFSIDEIIEEKTTDGKMAYLKALVNDFNNNKINLKKGLEELQNSFETNYSFNNTDYKLTFLLNTKKPIIFAKTKSKDVSLNVELTDYQHKILLGLAAHIRKCEFDAEFKNKNVALHPHGWVEIQNEPELEKELAVLSHLFQSQEFKIENQKDKFFRLSVEPSIVYFAPQLFVYKAPSSFTRKDVKISITRKSLFTAFGNTKEIIQTFTITKYVAQGLKSIAETNPSIYDDNTTNEQDRYRKSDLKKQCQSLLALNTLVVIEDTKIKFCAIYDEDTNLM